MRSILDHAKNSGFSMGRGSRRRENRVNEKAAQDRWIPGAILFLRRATPKLDDTLPSERAADK